VARLGSAQAANGEDANIGLTGAFSSLPASHELGHAGGYVPECEKHRGGGQTAHDGEQPGKLLLRLLLMPDRPFSPFFFSQNRVET
jgi:hypothetical protein